MPQEFTDAQLDQVAGMRLICTAKEDDHGIA
jgi:hypothetical protein